MAGLDVVACRSPWEKRQINPALDLCKDDFCNTRDGRELDLQNQADQVLIKWSSASL